MLQKNQIYLAEIDGYSAEGMGVARIDGEVVFVAGALSGEVCRIRILKTQANVAYAKIEEIQRSSPERRTPDCPYDKRCGGCALRHMSYEEELRMKRQRVCDALWRIGGVSFPDLRIHPSPETSHYRNKAQYPVATVDGAPAAGFFRARSHELIAIDRCFLQTEAADTARAAVVEYMKEFSVSAYDETTHRGLVRHVYVRCAARTGQVLVCLVVNGRKLPHEQALVARLRARVKGLTSVVISVNTKRGNVILGEEFRAIFGDGMIEDVLCGLRFQLSPRSFYQVNRAQAERLYEAAIAMADLTRRDTVLDLYCGIGTITLAMARYAGRAIGVEIIPQAVEDARKNAAANGLQNAEFFCADAGTAAKQLVADGVHPDVVVVDPPRKGLAPEAVEMIATLAPQRVVYVSCDPATLARDVNRLCEKGYTACTAEAFDMFPRCAHVECVILMQRSGLEDEK